jgi:1-acyl-sn-glycerol-3-phosphate acyltransferase
MTVYGKENIPDKGAVLFIGNHENGLIDSILIPLTTKRVMYFLSRASAFKNALVSKLLYSLNMIPIFRIRDGVNTIEKNKDTFEQCYEILNNGGAIEIFAEGEHHLDRRVLPLKKGFARIILGTLQKYPETEIQIVPVGINYDSRINFPMSVSIYYGEPISANQYFDLDNVDEKFTEIMNKMSSVLQELTLHIEDMANYDAIIQQLEKHNVNYLDPFEANALLKNIDSLSKNPVSKIKQINWFAPLHILAKINSIIPLLIWRYLKGRIKEIIFTNTFRFVVITALFPIIYIIQAAVVYSIFNLKYAVSYLLISIVLGLISTKTMTVNKSIDNH